MGAAEHGARLGLSTRALPVRAGAEGGWRREVQQGQRQPFQTARLLDIARSVMMMFIQLNVECQSVILVFCFAL